MSKKLRNVPLFQQNDLLAKMQKAENTAFWAFRNIKGKLNDHFAWTLKNKAFVPENFLISHVDRWPLLHVEVVHLMQYVTAL